MEKRKFTSEICEKIEKQYVVDSRIRKISNNSQFGKKTKKINLLSANMRKLFKLFIPLGFFIMGIVVNGRGQTVNAYYFTTGTGAVLSSPSWTTLLGAGMDDDISALTNIGFTFVYEGINYTQFSVCPNGLLRLGSTIMTNVTPNQNWNNNITNAGNQPKIMPFWANDLSTGTGNVRTGIVGTTPNQVRIVEWNVCNVGGTTSSTPYTSTFQVKFYETTKVIEFVYGTGINQASGSMSCGIGGVTSTNYLSVTTSSHTSSNSSPDNFNSTWPGSGRYYQFSPTAPAVLSANTLTAFGSVCTNTIAGPNSFTITGTALTTANVTVGPLTGYSFSSTSGGSYTSSLSLVQSGGAYSQAVYVKFNPTLVQSYSANIPVGGGGASAINVAVSGSGVNTAPTSTSGSASSITAISATVVGSFVANCATISSYGIEYSTTSGFANGLGTLVASTNQIAGSYTSSLIGLNPTTTYYFHAYAKYAAGASTVYGNQGSFTTATPALTVGAITDFGNVCINTIVGPNSFLISGTNLTAANVTVAALTGYTYSTTAGGTYTTTLSLVQTGGAYSQTIYVKFNPTLVQSYNGNISVGGGGDLTPVLRSVVGAGINDLPTSTSGVVSLITTTSATVAGSYTSGCSTINSYGIEYSTTNGFANGSGTLVASTNQVSGSYTSSISGLNPTTIYYFHSYVKYASGASTVYGTQGTFTTLTPPPIYVSATLATVGPTGYATLKDAFDAINLGTHKGAITVTIVNNTTETLTAQLNASGGTSSYTSVAIYPTSANLKISGNISSGAIIYLYQADNVTINGAINAIGATKSLTVENLSNSSTSLTSTIRLYDGASNNKITNCIILGSSTVTTSLTGGTLLFDAPGTLGNGDNNNTVSDCKIGNASTGLPVKAVFSKGAGSSQNINNIITGCEIYNYASSTNESYGLYLSTDNSDWIVSNNSFYQTSSISLANKHYPIFVNTTGGNIVVTGNYVGGNNANHTGKYTITAGGENVFIGINATSSGVKSYITNNTIANISQTTTIGSSGSSTIGFYGINITSGSVNVTGNTIGSQTDPSSILYTNTSTNYYTKVILLENSVSNGASLISDNNMGGIILTSNYTLNSGVELTCINSNLLSAQTFTCKNNIIGSPTAPIVNTSKSSSGHNTSFGIYGLNAVCNVSNNIIRNLIVGENTSGSSTRGQTVGIWINNDANKKTVTDNTIYNLSNINISGGSEVYGIYFLGSSLAVDSDIARNFIYNLNCSSTAGTSEITGIKIREGRNVISNNIISLYPSSSGALVYGIHDYGSNATTINTHYYNTVCISATPSAGTTESAAFYSNSGANTKIIKNNLFYNSRTGSNVHYAEVLNSSTLTTHTENYNNLYSATTNLCKMGITNYINLATWKTATSQNLNSISNLPNFITSAANGTTPGEYFPQEPLLKSGLNIAGYSDYFGTLREATPTMGAIERVDIYQWDGSTSTDWFTLANWTLNSATPAVLPTSSDDVLIDVLCNSVPVTIFPDITSIGAVCNRLTIKTGTNIKISPDANLTVSTTIYNLVGTGGLIIKSSDIGSGSLIFETANINGTVQTYQSGTQWHYISSPISICDRSYFTDNTLYKWDASIEWLGMTPTIDYTPWSFMSGTLINGIGYANYTTTQTVSLSGALNQGDFTLKLSHSATGTEANQGWNLIGNPYTSAIDWDLVVAEPSFSTTGIEGAIYFFNDNAQDGLQANYRYYVPASPGTGGTYSVGSSVGITNYIPACQGFFVKAKLDNMNIFLKNSHRVHNTQNYYKAKETITNLLRLNIVNGDYNDELVVRFVDGATSSFDGSYDARKLFPESYNIPMLYAMNPAKDETMAICSNGLISENTQIPLGIRTNSGEFTINVSEFVFDSDVKIYLYDALNNSYTDLSTQAQYTFTAEQGYNIDRFSLVSEKNIAPQINIVLNNKSTMEDSQFNLTIDANTFVDNNLFDEITYSANVPTWLAFDSNTMTISGISNNDLVGMYNIDIVATDKLGSSNSQTFQLEVINVNDDPVLVQPIYNQLILAETHYSFTFNENVFVDVDQNDVLTYNALLKDNNSLPTWLFFDTEARTFFGFPQTKDIGIYTIELTATDLFGVSTSNFFDITVTDYISSISNINKILNVSPNPSKGIFNIKFNNSNINDAQLNVSDITGKILISKNITTDETSLNLTNYTSGVYFLEIIVNDKITRVKLMID